MRGEEVKGGGGEEGVFLWLPSSPSVLGTTVNDLCPLLQQLHLVRTPYIYMYIRILSSMATPH